MKAILPALLILALATGYAQADESHGHDAPSDAERAVCQVCRVHEGETEAELVVASADFGGQTFGFCSDKCRDTFVKTPESYLPPVFPRPAPDFTVRELDGTEVSSETFRGKTLLLDFWATWCPPCIEDLPELTSLHEQYGEDGLVVLSVSIDEGKDAARKVRRMIRRRDARHPVYLDAAENSAWGAYQVRVVPTQFLIDSEGQIVAQWSGKIDLAEVEARISGLLAGNEDETAKKE